MQAQSRIDEAGLASIPLELVEGVASYLPRTKDVSSLSKTSRLMNQMLQRSLYRFDGVNNANNALHSAASRGHVRVALAALAYGADVDNCVTWLRETPLQVAARNGNVEIVRILVAAGADVENNQSQDGGTPLATAARFGHFACVEVLVREGRADPAAKNTFGETPLHQAAERLNLEAAAFLYPIAPASLDTRSVDGRTPLLAAVRAGERCVPMVHYLLRHGANIHGVCIDGLTAYTFAAKFGLPDVVLALVQHDERILTTTDNMGKTMMHHAAEQGHMDVVRTLICAGASVTMRDDNLMSPLDYAIQHKFDEIKGILLGFDLYSVIAGV